VKYIGQITGEQITATRINMSLCMFLKKVVGFENDRNRICGGNDMDYIMDIVLTEQGLKELNMEEQYVTWGGVQLQQEPRKYRWKSTLDFVQSLQKKSYYEELLGRTIPNEEIVSLTVDEDALQELEEGAQGGNGVSDNILFRFLGELENFSEYAIVLLREEEIIDLRISGESIGSVQNLVCQSMKRDNAKGIVIDCIRI